MRKSESKHSLATYQRMRNFKRTPEPAGKRPSAHAKLAFVVQEHHASHLHYDFRLEVNGVLRSWAVPKGPSMNPSDKRLAVEVEDHPYEYRKFEGVIPENEYGAGRVYIWDEGTWVPQGDPELALEKGRLEFELRGKRLRGRWLLLRTRLGARGSKPSWLLMKRPESPALTPSLAPDPADARAQAPARPSSDDARMPAFVRPELALLVDAPPKGEQWVHETKFDGYRIQARVDGDDIRLLTRTGQDWSARYPSIVAALKKLRLRRAILDGEVVALDKSGRSDFQALQNAQSTPVESLVYYAFDLIYWRNEDLRRRPLLERKAKLEEVLARVPTKVIRYSDHIRGTGDDFLRVACEHRLEGVISKRIDSPYLSARTGAWVKSKCKFRQEFVIGGYTEGQGARERLGALLLGVYENGKLRYVGRVGTGFDQAGLARLLKKLAPLATRESPFALASPRERGVHWVKPRLVAEVAFADWTRDRRLRAPVFQGLREDKPAHQVSEERAQPVRSAAQGAGASATTDAALTHPDKLIFASENVRKRDLAEYYDLAAKWMLPHVAGRPVSLIRCPQGTREKCFFQRHLRNQRGEGLVEVPLDGPSGREVYLAIESPAGLRSLVQIGAFEIHAWNCRSDSPDRPDQIVMDFDPADDVPWRKVVEAALRLKKILDRLGLPSYVKLSGGKGVHLHVPFEPRYDWDSVLAFARSLAEQLETEDPDRITATLAKSARRGKIFIDYLRNSFAATAVAPYSVRAKERSSVAMPISWRDLRRTQRGGQYNLAAAIALLKRRRRDPWAGYASEPPRIAILERDARFTRSARQKGASR